MNSKSYRDYYVAFLDILEFKNQIIKELQKNRGIFIEQCKVGSLLEKWGLKNELFSF